MGILRPETVKLMAREIYDYDIADEATVSLARGAGALLAGSFHLSAAFDLGGVEPPFGFPNLEAEAERIRRTRKS
jgi:hypothetical protein